MDRAFLTYYEAELSHIRDLAAEFAALHPNVARNLSLEATPCPDPYVERLLEGVAWLAARTRLKLDTESSRQVADVLNALYPDLVGPAPATGMAVLHPGPQVMTMDRGHVVKRGTRLVSSIREGLTTRAIYTTAQDVALWPIALESAEYLQDRGALTAGGASPGLGAEAGLRLVLSRSGPGALGDLSPDRLDLCFAGSPRAAAIFDAVFGHAGAVLARPADGASRFNRAAGPEMIGLSDTEALLPRLRPSFEGYRLLREYFLMPERFHFLRLGGLGATMRACGTGKLDILIPFTSPRPALAAVTARDFTLFATPVVNLFEMECNVVELDPRAAAHIVHPDRARPRDFEVYRLIRVEDADSEGPHARLADLYGADPGRSGGLVYTVERRPRRPGEDEIRRGQTRTSYLGDDLYISVARPHGVTVPPVKRLDIRALCTNRDLPILDDSPRLSLESGDPVVRVDLIGAVRRPRPALVASLPRVSASGESQLDEVVWRLVGQLSLNHLSLAGESSDGAPLRAVLDLYADRGDPVMARHAQSITGIAARPVTERLDRRGPLCFGQGVEITLDIDETLLTGGPELLLPALLNRLFARHAAVNAFVRTRTRLLQKQEEVSWPVSPGNRAPI